MLNLSIWRISSKLQSPGPFKILKDEYTNNNVTTYSMVLRVAGLNMGEVDHSQDSVLVW